MTTSPPPPGNSSPSSPEPTFPQEPDPISLPLLKSAWERHQVFSSNASSAQARFLLLERMLAALGVLVVVLAVAQPTIQNQIALARGLSPAQLEALKMLSFQKLAQNRENWPLASTTFLLILIPIFMTGLRAFAAKFSRGESWVLLRGSAEALKIEIFYYRTGVKPYNSNRNALLAQQLKLMSERLKGSTAHQKALTPYENQAPTQLKLGLVLLLLNRLITLVLKIIRGIWEFLFQYKEVPVPSVQPAQESTPPRQFSRYLREWLTQGVQTTRLLSPSPVVEDDPSSPIYHQRYAPLDPPGYIQYRLEDQFNWYRRKAKFYDRQYQVLQTSVYIFGGFGTLLAAIGFQSWVAVMATLASAFVNYLEYRRVEVTLVGYNLAADTLYDIRAWWFSLSETEKNDPLNFEKLVFNTEATIRSENTSWLQDMQDRLANLYKDTGEPKKPEPKEAKQDDSKDSDA